MSDFLAILVSGETALHLVDYDKPVWIKPNDVRNLRVVPHPSYMVADALIAHKYGALDSCGGTCNLNPAGLNLLDAATCDHVATARIGIYESHKDPIVIIRGTSGLDVTIESDLDKFHANVISLKLTNADSEKIGLVS